MRHTWSVFLLLFSNAAYGMLLKDMRKNLEILSQVAETEIKLLEKERTSPKTPSQIYFDIKKCIDKQCKYGTYQHNFDTSEYFTAEKLLETAQAFVAKMKECLGNTPWISGGTQNYYFVRKVILPPGSVIEFGGDLHADVDGLFKRLESLRADGWFDEKNIFKLKEPKKYLAFLGDYADRGHYGAEVMYIIMHLFLNNPDNVFIVRGNHEDIHVASAFGFLGLGGWIPDYTEGELAKKFGEKFADGDTNEIATLMEIYKYMPVALFLGCENGQGTVDFVQCCHGGMEPAYDSKTLLEHSAQNVYEWLDEEMEHEQVSSHNGFQWNDFDFFNEKPKGAYTIKEGRGKVFHKKCTTEILKRAGGKNNVWAVFHAHDHNEKTVPHILKYGNGVYKHWSEKTTRAQDWGDKKNTGNIQWSGNPGDAVPIEKYSVWIFNVAPRTGCYEQSCSDIFTYDTVAQLKLAQGFDNWKLYPRKIQ